MFFKTDLATDIYCFIHKIFVNHGYEMFGHVFVGN